MKLGFVAIIAVAWSGQVSGAAIAAATEPFDGKPVIIIEGDIASGDEDRFRSISSEHPSAFVVLRSDGGQILPAIEIGEAIREAGYDTVVLSGDTCASACALIWAAGSIRWMASDGRVGFHAGYRSEDGKTVESGVANAMIGHYLAQLGYAENASIFATVARPNEVLWLTRDRDAVSGISFETVPDRWDLGQLEQARAGPPPILVSPTPPLIQIGQAVLQYDWMWGSRDAPKVFEFEDYETGDTYHIRAPATTSEQAVLDLLTEYVEGRWISFAGTPSGTEVFFDLESIEANASVVKVWVRHDYSDDASKTDREYIERVYVNCDFRTQRGMQGAYYRPDGSIRDTFYLSGPLQSFSITPESVGESLWKTVCWQLNR